MEKEQIPNKLPYPREDWGTPTKEDIFLYLLYLLIDKINEIIDYLRENPSKTQHENKLIEEKK
jgi:hypothetical protein